MALLDIVLDNFTTTRRSYDSSQTRRREREGPEYEQQCPSRVGVSLPVVRGLSGHLSAGTAKLLQLRTPCGVGRDGGGRDRLRAPERPETRGGHEQTADPRRLPGRVPRVFHLKERATLERVQVRGGQRAEFQPRAQRADRVRSRGRALAEGDGGARLARPAPLLEPQPLAPPEVGLARCHPPARRQALDAQVHNAQLQGTSTRPPTLTLALNTYTTVYLASVQVQCKSTNTVLYIRGELSCSLVRAKSDRYSCKVCFRRRTACCKATSRILCTPLATASCTACSLTWSKPAATSSSNTFRSTRRCIHTITVQYHTKPQFG